MCLRATIGNAPFAGEKQGEPINPEQCEWDASYPDYPGFWLILWRVSMCISLRATDSSGGMVLLMYATLH